MTTTMAPAPTVPALGEALRFVQMSGVFYCPSELTEPWGLEIPSMADTVWFHAVTQGTCTVEVDGSTVTIGPGDLVVLPHGTGHAAWGAEVAPTPSVFDLPHEYENEHYAVLRHGGGGDLTKVVCGGVRFDHPAARHLIDALPPLIHLAAAPAAPPDWIQATIGLMAEETRLTRPGSEAVISRLCDIVVIQAIRSWIEHDPAAQTGWLGALRDDQIGIAIARIHAEPERDWSVVSLADEVAMSRSAFAARFTELVGEPAMRYVTRWRMYFAADLLQRTDATAGSVARRVGYDSEAAFNRAFKRVMGQSPGAFRRQTVVAG